MLMLQVTCCIFLYLVPFAVREVEQTLLRTITKCLVLTGFNSTPSPQSALETAGHQLITSEKIQRLNEIE